MHQKSNRKNSASILTLSCGLILPTFSPVFAADTGRQGNGPAVKSTGTVVVARTNESNKIKAVGTSTIIVMNGTRVGELEVQITAKDHSQQTYDVFDQNNNEEKSGTSIENGDKLIVTAADGQSRFTYNLSIYDPTAKDRDGVYWNEDLYNQIDKATNFYRWW